MPKKLTMAKLADKPSEVYLPKSDNQKIMELKRLLIDGAGRDVVGKALQIAMNDDHPAQAAMIKLCLDRMLPVSLFEKGVAARSAVTISITGIGDSVNINGESMDLTPIEPPMKTINDTGGMNGGTSGKDSNDSGYLHSINGAAHN
jgi:hypothetical protein